MSDSNSSSQPSEIQLWSFDTKDVRIVDRAGNPWFVGVDACGAWGLKNSRQAMARLDSCEKDAVQIVDAIGRRQTVQIISEAGLYALISRSNLPEAKRFWKWVRSEVLPSIRRTGTYTIKEDGVAKNDIILETLVASQTMIAQTLAALGGATAEVKQDVAEVKQDVTAIKQVVEIQSQQIEELKKLAPIPGYMTLAGFSSLKGIRPSREEMGYWGKRLGTHCRTHSVERIPVPDQRYGKVYSYPLTVLEATFSSLGPR